ncbi:MAG: cytochrome c peroxidase [Flavobacteriales bacterium]
MRAGYLASLLLLAACRRDEAVVQEAVNPVYAVQLAPGSPPLPVPAENPLTKAGVELGRELFFEARLSRNAVLSCAGCHHPLAGFSDTVALSVGADGDVGFRNAPTLSNVAYQQRLFMDGGIPNLEYQVLAPIHDVHEMDSDINEVAELLRDEEPFKSLSQLAYGRTLDAFVITRAIASYERTLVSGWSRFDRYVYSNDATALTPQELNGWGIFSSAGANCTACHTGYDLTDRDFHNVGLTTDHSADEGRARITLQPEDVGKFKTPTLRNIALTGPYMHDGSLSTLEQVVDHFASGGLPQPNLSPQMQPFFLTQQEKADLIAFLHALTDDRSLDQVP